MSCFKHYESSRILKRHNLIKIPKYRHVHCTADKSTSPNTSFTERAFVKFFLGKIGYVNDFKSLSNSFKKFNRIRYLNISLALNNMILNIQSRISL